ncbi:fimbrial protein [Enterobacter sp. JBIWA005]|uniref:fimbrial protein n=2 Tax=Enterobacter TaxID=547 RepID=UPI001CBA89C5|nr:fimbrial protein [Enterobacter sp. JBIWA005]UAN29958.1 hypothetical protein KGP22_11855 [Enterobacter sp. JBIWA005]
MHNIKSIIEMLVFIFFTMLPFLPASCFATWTNTPGIHENSTGKLVCPITPDTIMSNLTADDYSQAGCTLDVGEGNEVPYSGNYHLILVHITSDGISSFGQDSAAVYIKAGVELNTLNLVWATTSISQLGRSPNRICYVLKSSRSQYFTFNNTEKGCKSGTGGTTPLPSPFHCTFGDGSTLNISLGDVDRAKIGAVPGTLPGTEKNISITCTGDGKATHTISFKYTAVNIAGTEMISSTANGLAVAMSLNDELVSPTDTYSRTYSTGTQTEKLTFEPVRNPSVKIGDIPTGPFSASAVMILTVQ